MYIDFLKIINFIISIKEKLIVILVIGLLPFITYFFLQKSYQDFYFYNNNVITKDDLNLINQKLNLDAGDKIFFETLKNQNQVIKEKENDKFLVFRLSRNENIGNLKEIIKKHFLFYNTKIDLLNIHSSLNKDLIILEAKKNSLSGLVNLRQNILKKKGGKF